MPPTSHHEVLVIFTRFPQLGRAKTRLIPALGAEGAVALHRELAELTVARSWTFAAGCGAGIEVRFDGGSLEEMRRWLGRSLRFEPQGSGDLGERLALAMQSHFASGARAVVMIGSDCPDLGEWILRQAFDALRAADVVFGPAKDGGYYLIGMTKPMPQVFENIPWGASTVLQDSLAIARKCGLQTALLPELSDVDVPEDLPVWEIARAASRRVSVIIPALNEAVIIGDTLRQVQASNPHEIIVVDGDSVDGTARFAAAAGARVILSPRGRAIQMNTGAAAACGEFLLFLHADTSPPVGYPNLVCKTLNRAGVAAGAFSFRLRERFAGAFVLERLVNLRSRWLGLPYGDQGLFMRRSLFEAVSGFPAWPLLEDLEMVKRLRRLGRVVTLREPAVTSSQRWIEHGLLQNSWRNQQILLGHWRGEPLETLAARYRR